MTEKQSFIMVDPFAERRCETCENWDRDNARDSEDDHAICALRVSAVGHVTLAPCKYKPPYIPDSIRVNKVEVYAHDGTECPCWRLEE